MTKSELMIGTPSFHQGPDKPNDAAGLLIDPEQVGAPKEFTRNNQFDRRKWHTSTLLAITTLHY